jgi:hypothetical protein
MNSKDKKRVNRKQRSKKICLNQRKKRDFRVKTLELKVKTLDFKVKTLEFKVKTLKFKVKTTF